MTGVWFIRRPWPTVSGTIGLPFLQAPVEILRDKWGIPHIFAQNSRDLFFSQGYVQAQDRMWQLEFTRRVGNGRLAEALGEESISVDRFARVLGFRRAAERDWQAMAGEDRAAMEAYAAGVNAFIEGNRHNLSLEFTIFGVDPDPWTPVDSLVIAKLMSWILSENASIEMSRARIIAASGEAVARELLTPYREGAPVTLPPEFEGYNKLGAELVQALKSVSGTVGRVGASNGWVIAGSRTASRSAMVANDTHLDLFMPSVWYANGIHGEGLDLVGYSLAGTPGVIIGHNLRIAWGVTDLVADVQDLYIEQLDNPSDPQRYMFRGEWQPLKIEAEVIRVKDSSPVTINVARTNHGPLINQFLSHFKDSKPLTVAWSGEDSPQLIRSIISLNRSGNWTEFREALRQWDGPNMSFVYADVDGNIGFQAAGRIPVRAPQNQGIIPEPGWKGDCEWQGYIPFDDLPRSYNPPSGFIVTANQKLVTDDYPYRLGYEWADPYRAVRIDQLLSENNQVTVEDSERIQGDTYHLLAERLREYLKSVSPANDLEKQALREVLSWNLHCDPEEAGAAIYQVWYRFLLEDAVSDELGPELTNEYLEYYWVHGPAMLSLMKDGANRIFDDTRTEQVESRDNIVQRAFSDAVAWLKKRYGSNPTEWKWGRLHTLSFRHRPFGMVDVPIISKLFNSGTIVAPGGDRFTVNCTWFTWDDPANPYAADAGSAQRIVMDLSDWDRTTGVNSTGQSEHLFHPHREDAIPMWQNLKSHPLLFNREAIEASTYDLLKLVPGSVNGN
ncbi:MAG: penicillin acylase family protein [Blastocatellia bacterium]